MAQNECQQMSLAEFYSSLRNIISTMYNTMQRLERAQEFLGSMDATTAASMGMQTQARDDVADFRTAVNEIMDFYDGTATGRTKVLKDQINKLRYI